MKFVLLFLLLQSSIALGALFGSNNEVSEKNSTTTVLASGASFTGEWEVCYMHATITVAVTTDLDGTLNIQFSPDGVNQDSSLTYKFNAGTTESPHRLQIARRWCRVKFTNDGTTTQTYLRLQTTYAKSGAQLVAPMNATLGLDADAVPVRSISEELDIAEGKRQGHQLINKFGSNTDIDTATDPEDVCNQGGTYAGFPVSDSEKVEVLSSSANDDLTGSGAEKVYIYGLDENWEMAEEEITLDGTTPVDSVGTYRRVWRAIVTQSNNGSNDAFNAGTITIRHTTTTANVFAVIPIGANQSRCTAFTVPANKTAFVRDIHFTVNRGNAAVDINGAIWVRDFGKAPRLIRIFSASDTEPYVDEIYGFLKFTEKTDFVIRVDNVSANDTNTVANYDIVLVDNI